jgi:hypothetical protein
MKQSVWFLKQIKKRVRARKLRKQKDLISYEELIGKLVRLHDSLFIVNGDLVIQKSVGTETSNLLTNKNIIRK